MHLLLSIHVFFKLTCLLQQVITAENDLWKLNVYSPRSGLSTGKGDGCCISLSTGYLYSPCTAHGSLFFGRMADFSFKRALSSNKT